MFFREFHHDERDEHWGVWCYPAALVTNAGKGMAAFDFGRLDFSSTHTWPPNPLSEAERAIRAKEAAGFRETPRSLSRRWFEESSSAPGKFWIVELDDRLVAIHFGRIPKNSHHGYFGQRKFKEFPAPEKAKVYYTKMIREKIAAGYVELHPRPEPG